MRSRPHNALHLDVSHSGTSTLARCDGGATGAVSPDWYQIFSPPNGLGAGGNRRQDSCLLEVQNPNTEARPRRTTRN